MQNENKGMLQRKGARVLIPILSFVLLLCVLAFYSQVISSHATPAPARGQGSISKTFHQNHQQDRFSSLELAADTPTSTGTATATATSTGTATATATSTGTATATATSTGTATATATSTGTATATATAT